MPVLVTGATGMVGRALVTRLLTDGGQVRVYLRRDDAALRAAGAHVALGAIDDVARLEAALTRVHTLVHLVGGWWPDRGTTYDLLNRDSTEAAVIAANAADVERFVFLSFPGADPGDTNEFLAAKGRAEEHIARTGIPHTIIRCAPSAEEWERTIARGRRGPVVWIPGDGTQRWNPIALVDVVEAIVAADARDQTMSGVWELGGPTAMSVDEIAAQCAGRARIMHVAGLAGAPRPLNDLLAREVLNDPTDAAAQFGLTLTPAWPGP